MSVTVLPSPMRAFTTVCATAAVSEGTINKISPSAVPMARSASRMASVKLPAAAKIGARPFPRALSALTMA